jgi:hypothetical protein
VDVNRTNSEGLTPLCVAMDMYKKYSWIRVGEGHRSGREYTSLIGVFLANDSGSDLDVTQALCRAYSWDWDGLVMVLLLKLSAAAGHTPWDLWEAEIVRQPPIHAHTLVLAVYLGWAPSEEVLDKVCGGRANCNM